jgi:hypothetical protein
MVIDPGGIYETEELARLMHGIKYMHGVGEFAYIQTNLVKPTSTGNPNVDTPALEEYYRKIFRENYGLFAAPIGSMKIVWTPNSQDPTKGTLLVYPNKNATTPYYEHPAIPIGDAKVYIQSHWGSGVAFAGITIS